MAFYAQKRPPMSFAKGAPLPPKYDKSTSGQVDMKQNNKNVLFHKPI